MCVRMHQLREELLKCQVFLYDDSSGNGTEPMHVQTLVVLAVLSHGTSSDIAFL